MNPHLESPKSTRISLYNIYKGIHNLDAHRTALLARAPNSNDYAELARNSIKIIDLAYLTAKTSHEFALLRGKHKDVLFHGEPLKCTFNSELKELLMQHKLSLIAHSHPYGDIPAASYADRNFLKEIKQHSSIIISATTGKTNRFTDDEFTDAITN